MTFKEYKINGESYFEKQRGKIYRNTKSKFKDSVSKKETKKLEKFLNDLFYPKDGNSNYGYMNLITRAFEEKTGKVLSNFNIGSQNVKLESINQGIGIFQEKHEAFSHAHYIEVQTLKTRFDKVEQAIKRIQSVKQAEEGQEKILKELEQLAKDLDKIIKKFDGQEKIILDNNKALSEEINRLDEVFKNISAPSITPEDFGTLLEIALGILDIAVEEAIAEDSEAVIDLLIDKNNVSSPVKGGQRVGGDTLFSLESALSVSKKDEVSVKRSTGQRVKIQMGDIILDADIPKAGASRQGKIDVLLNLKEVGNKPFRISAKNWIQSGDFGESPLSAIFQRTVDSATVLENYIYTMGLQDDQSTLVSAHNMAKFSILVDTLVGYSQEENWVDTLVINKRGKGVIVEHIPSLIKQCYDNINYNKISYSYKENELESGGKKYYEEFLENVEQNEVGKNSLRYKTAMISLMGAMHVHAKYHTS